MNKFEKVLGVFIGLIVAWAFFMNALAAYGVRSAWIW